MKKRLTQNFKVRKLIVLMGMGLCAGSVYAIDTVITIRPGNLSSDTTISVLTGDSLTYKIPGRFTGSGGVFSNVYNDLTFNVADGGLVRFVNNESSSAGGAINFMGSVGSPAVLEVNHAEFIGNKATGGVGGAIYAGQFSTINIRNTLFSNNSSISSGGALYVGSDATVVTLTDSVFVNNASGQLGGGAIATNGTVNINITKDLTYSGNTNGLEPIFIRLLGTVGDVNFDIASGKTLKIDDALSNVSSVTSTMDKRGDGILSLYGNSDSFSRPIAVHAGGLDVGHRNALGNGAPANIVTFLGHGALSNNSLAALSIKQPITINAGVTATTKGSSDLTLSGLISGAGALSKSGANDVYLTNNNTYTGGTSVSEGALVLGQNTVTGSIIGDITVGANGTIAFHRQDNYTYGGTVSGAGAVEKRGSSTLTLSGTNSYTGGTRVLAGTLVGSSSSIRGNILNEGIVEFNQTVSGTHTGNITGSGSLVKKGLDDLTLVGSHSYTGGTQVNSGRLIGEASSLQGSITNNSILEFKQSTDGTYAGVLSGAGDLVKNGIARLTLAANAHAGNVSVSAGALNIGANTILTVANAVDIAAGSTLGVDVSSSPAVIADTVLLNNTPTIDITGYSPTTDTGTYTLVTTSSGVTGNFVTTVAGIPLHTYVDFDTYLIGSAWKDATSHNILAQLELVWNNNDPISAHGTFNIPAGESFDVGITLANNTIPGALGFGWNGQSLSKKGAGTLLLNEVNSYTGLTDIQAGKLIIGSTASHNTATIAGNVNVASGATLGGHGQILGDVQLASGSTIAPGNSIGTLTVGSITFNAGSIYEFEANQDGTADKINATGSATLHGGTAHVNANGNIWSTTDVYTLLTANSGITGAYDKLTSNLAFLDGELSYDANNVYLKLKRNSTSMWKLGGSYNQNTTGWGIESLGSDNAIYKRIISMDRFSALNAFDNLSGEIHASAKSAMLSNSRYVRSVVNQHLQIRLPEPGNNVWGQIWSHDGHIKNDDNAARLKNKGAGILFGADFPINDTTQVGIAAGYEQTKANASGLRQSDADVDAYHVMLYGKTQAGPVDLRAGLGYARLNIDTTRNIWVEGLQSQNKASYNGDQMQAFIEGSHTYKLNEQVQLTPYVNLSYAQVKTDDFVERGNVTALIGYGNTSNMTTVTAGIQGQMQVGAQKQHSLYADLGLQARRGDKAPEARMSFIGGEPYRIKGTNQGSNSVLIGLGANLELKTKLKLTIGYEGEYGSQIRDSAFKAKLQWQF